MIYIMFTRYGVIQRSSNFWFQTTQNLLRVLQSYSGRPTKFDLKTSRTTTSHHLPRFSTNRIPWWRRLTLAIDPTSGCSRMATTCERARWRHDSRRRRGQGCGHVIARRRDGLTSKWLKAVVLWIISTTVLISYPRNPASGLDVQIYLFDRFCTLNYEISIFYHTYLFISHAYVPLF